MQRFGSMIGLRPVSGRPARPPTRRMIIPPDGAHAKPLGKAISDQSNAVKERPRAVRNPQTLPPVPGPAAARLD
jgi:hypothetical protein